MTNLHHITNEDLGLEVRIIRDYRGIVAIAKDTDANEIITVRIWGHDFPGNDAEIAAVGFAHMLVDNDPAVNANAAAQFDTNYGLTKAAANLENAL